MKLVIQIPCYNEEDLLKQTLDGLPSSILGVDEIEIVVIDDGSTDKTGEIATACGVRHILRFPRNRGLAKAFIGGINHALGLNADVIVNTDADNQYPGSEIEKLIRPILNKEADIVIGDRQVKNLRHFSIVKKVLQKIGSFTVRKLSRTKIPDVVSGFRAYSRNAAMRMNVVSDYSYTVETLIQAGRDRLAIASVPIEANPTERPSRLIKSIPQFIRRTAATIIRTYTMYQPLKVFFWIGFLMSMGGIGLFGRFLYFALILGDSSGHIQSLIVAAVLSVTGFQTLLIGLLSDVVSANRRLIEELLIVSKQKVLDE